MAYIGTIPAEAYTSFAVQHFTTSATDTFTLDFPVANENEIALFINNVRQEPGSSYAYTASGTTLTLSSAITGSDSMYCVFIGKAVQTVTPASGSVTNDMLAGSIANAKLANSSITLNGSSVSLGGSATITEGITMADQWRLSADFSLPTGVSDITTNLERADTRGAGQIGSAMTVSSGVFTFPSTGYYLVTLDASFYTPASNGNLQALINYTSDNSSYSITAFIWQSTNANQSLSFGMGSTSILLDITDTANQKIKLSAGGGPGGSPPGVLRGDTDQNETVITFVRLGDT